MNTAAEVLLSYGDNFPPTLEAIQFTGFRPEQEVIGQIRETHLRRETVKKMLQRIERQCDAILARAIGYDPQATQKERKKVFAQAQNIYKAVKNDTVKKLTEAHQAIAKEFMGMLIVAADCVEPILKQRKCYDRELERLVKALDIWTEIDRIKGIGPVSFGMLIGEIGNLNDYSGPAKIWKRMGVAVHDGKRQQKRRGTEEGKKEGYSPRRRAVLWQVTDSLMKNNKGKYRRMADARYKYELARDTRTEADFKDKSDKRPLEKKRHGRAKARSFRYASKELLKDIWRLWTGIVETLDID